MGNEVKNEEAAGRIFTRYMKQLCWNKSQTVPGRDLERWRFDPAGNILCRKLTGCEGCLCHEYDHIIPFSKGGKTEVENCQILQSRANRYKGNEDNDVIKLRGYSCAYKFTERELDIIEMAVYGNVKREGNVCRCKSVYELNEEWKKFVTRKSKEDVNCV